MNKRFIGMFVIFFVAVLAMGSVSAVNHDFDDYFSMDIPKGTTFEKEDMSVNEGGVKMTDVVYFNDDLMVEFLSIDDASYHSVYPRLLKQSKEITASEKSEF